FSKRPYRNTSSEPLPVTASAEEDATARPRLIACIGEALAVSRSTSTRVGSNAVAPSGGCNGLMSGIGIGIGTLISGVWINTIGNPFSPVRKLKLIDSTFVNASMFMLSAGCGGPILISGPQYAVFTPGTGPGSM